jgi:predicted RNA binding protein YcfA (HicA-like mRNA interferase family)
MDSKAVIKALKKDGWVEVGQKGSHRQFRHPAKAGRVTVQHPVKDLKIGTLKSIQKQSRITF